jgi:hypothetical protein
MFDPVLKEMFDIDGLNCFVGFTLYNVSDSKLMEKSFE